MNSLQMKKLAATTIAAATMFAATANVSQAATVPAGFTVQVALTAACTAAAAPLLDFGTYTAFVGASIPAPTSAIAMTCTRGLAAPTFSFDAALGGNYGVIAGLNYSLGAAAGAVTAGTAATAALNAIGTADTYTVTITGGMPAGQAGACAGGNATACATAVTQARTLTITY